MLRHVCLEVKNMPVELVAAFYVEHFDMEVEYQETEKWELKSGMEAELKIIKLRYQDKWVLELVQHNAMWAPHICLEVDEWPNVALMEPKRLDKPHKDLEVRFLMDPSGNMIELVKRKEK